MDRRYCCAVAIAALALGGCAQRPFTDAAWPTPRPLGRDVEAYRPPDSPDSPDGADLPPVDAPRPPTGVIHLRHAMALALAHHPRLRAFAWEVRAAEARMLQAGLWPNPELEAELENFAGEKSYSGARSLESTVSLAQTVPLGGDISRRRELAGLTAQAAGWDYEAARLEVLTQVTQRYVALLAAQRRVALAREALAVTERVRDATARRIEAGDAPPIDAARAGASVATARVAMRRAERERQSAARQLALMWSSHEAAFDEASGSLDELAPPPSPQRLAHLLNENPQVARWAVEISTRRAEARLARAEAVPDPTVRAGYKYDRAEETGALLLGVSLPLPLFDRRQGDILAARMGAAAASQRKHEIERRLAAELSDACTRLAAGFDEATALRDEALPPATEAFELTQRAFEQGDVAFIDVLDAERTLVELRSAHLDALTTYHTAAAEIEGLIGQPLRALGNSAAPSGD